MPGNSYYNRGYAEGIAEGLNSAKIEYIYHQHTGSSSIKGGCYTKPVYVMETRSERCPGGYINDYGESTDILVCSVCHSRYPANGTKMGDPCSCYYEKQYSIGIIDHYDINCGKSETTIESATISF